MKTKRRTEITIETNQVLVVRRRSQVTLAWCVSCDQRVRMVTPDQAAVVAGVSMRTINRWVEADRLHFTETADGILFVCLISILENCKVLRPSIARLIVPG